MLRSATIAYIIKCFDSHLASYGGLIGLRTNNGMGPTL